MSYTLKGKMDEVISSVSAINTDAISTLASTMEGFDGTTITNGINGVASTVFDISTDTSTIKNSVSTIISTESNINTNVSTIANITNGINSDVNTILNTMALETTASTIVNNMALETTATTISNKLGEYGGATVQSYLYNISLITGSPLRKGVAFTNNQGTITLYTVTGAVRVRITAACITALAAAGGGSMTLKSGTNTLIAATTIADIGTGDLWYSATPTKTCEAYASACLDVVIGDGGDIAIEIEAEKQIDSGVMMFYVEWLPISWDGNVSPT